MNFLYYSFFTRHIAQNAPTEYANNAAALAAGLTAGQLYADGTSKAVTVVQAA